MFKYLSILLLTFLLCGCATMIGGPRQSVSVDIENVENASCTLNNDLGAWHIAQTPGSTTVARSVSDLYIVCRKNDRIVAIGKIESTFRLIVIGNIIWIYGIIPATILDFATGSAFNYESGIVLRKNY